MNNLLRVSSIRRLGYVAVFASIAAAAMFAQQNTTARITATPTAAPRSISPGAPETVITGLQSNANVVQPLPAIDNGPKDLAPTEVFVKRHLMADYEGQFSQDAAVYLPVYYHNGYLLLAPEDQVALRQLEKEISGWVQEQKALNQRLGGLLERLQILYERGRPRGVIQESQLLVPYAGSESAVKQDIEKLRVMRVGGPEGQSGSPDTVTGALNAVKVNPIRPVAPAK